MDVNNKGFPNETQNRKHSILKIVYMLAIMLMATSGFIMVSSNTEAKAWTCTGSNPYGFAHHSKSWYYNDSEHWQLCTRSNYDSNGCGTANRGTKMSEGSHSYENGVCKCGKSQPTSSCSHSWTTTYNDSYHWKECTKCGRTKSNSTAAHSYSTATCTSAPTCSCGRTNGSALSHSLSYTSVDDSYHKGSCANCTYTTGNQPHSMDNDKCSVCNYEGTGESISSGKACTKGKCYDRSGTIKACSCPSSIYGQSGGCVAGSEGDGWSWDNKSLKTKTASFSGCHGHKIDWDGSSEHRTHSGIAQTVEEPSDSENRKVTNTEIYTTRWLSIPRFKTVTHSQDCIVTQTSYKYWWYKFTCEFCSAGHRKTTTKETETNTTAPNDKFESEIVFNTEVGPLVGIVWTHLSYDIVQCSNCFVEKERTPNVSTLAMCEPYLSYTNQGASGHKAKCSVCKHDGVLPHNYGDWGDYISDNNGKHYRQRTCSKCGYVDNETKENCDSEEGTKTNYTSWSSVDGTWHKRTYTQNYTACSKCGWKKNGGAKTGVEQKEKHTTAGYYTSVTSGWKSDNNQHWKETTKYCNACSYNMGRGTDDSKGSHNWDRVAGTESGWTKGATQSSRTYQEKCGTCGRTRTSTEVCKHNGTTNASWKYGDWEYKDVNGAETPWNTPAPNTDATKTSSRAKRRVCGGCGYIDTGTDTCKHDGTLKSSWKFGDWEYKDKNGNLTSWVVGTSSTADTPSTKDKRRVCAGCNYINLGTNTCKHDGNTDGLKYGNWTPTAPGTWNEGEAQSTRPQTRTCGCGYTQKGTETCNHNGTPSGSHIVYTQISGNDTQHTKSCSYCTWSKKDNHIWKDSSTNNGWKQGDTSNHKRECSLCGYIEIKPHRWGDWVDINNDAVHQSTCADCKRTKTEAHLFSNVPTYDNYDTGYHYDKCQTKNASGVLTCNHITKGQHTLSDWLNNNPGDNGQVLSAPTGTHTHWCTFVNTSGKQCPYTRTENHQWIKVATDKPGFSKYQCSSTGCGAIQYTTNYYTVKFLPNGGSPNTIDEQTVTYTEGVALTEMTRTGYTFKGWQKYSGADSNNNTNTDPLINGNTEYFRFATNMLAGYNDNNMVVTLIAIWQHDHPTDTVDKVSITGGVSANASNPSGVGTAYYCNPKSTYTVTQRTVNNTSPYYVSSNGIEVVNASSGITLENATDFADSQTVAGEFIVHTLTSNATIKSTNNDGVIKLQPYSIRTCNWADTTRSCTSCKNVRTNGNQTALMFDGNAPLEDTINPLIAEWESPTGINYHYEQLNGRTLTIKATDVIGTYYSGLDASVCSIVLEGSDGSTRTLSKTPTTDVYGRITDYTFETFTIDETTPFFADGFKITWNFTDRVGNNSPTSKGSYKFNGFTVGITEFGSYTYQTETSDFTKGEAVYVKIKTTGYTDALNIKVPYDNVQYVYYADKTDAFVLENAHTENLILNASNTIDIMSYKNSGGVNRPGYINIDATFGDDKPEHEFYFIFIIPEDSTNTTGTVTVTGTKKALGTTMTKTDSRNFTIDTSTYITEGLHTIIRRTN